MASQILDPLIGISNLVNEIVKITVTGKVGDIVRGTLESRTVVLTGLIDWVTVDTVGELTTITISYEGRNAFDFQESINRQTGEDVVEVRLSQGGYTTCKVESIRLDVLDVDETARYPH